MNRFFLLILPIFPLVAVALTQEDAEGRLRVAMQIARERNDPALVAAVEMTGKGVQKSLHEGKTAGLDENLRALESKVGIDPGGWSMAGQPLFHPTAEMAKQLRDFGPQLGASMQTGDPARVHAVTAALLRVLGDQAGVPDARRPGRKPEPRSLQLSEADATKLFLAALSTQERYLGQLREGKPLPDQMLRFYGYLLEALTTVRPSVERHEPGQLASLDELTKGTASVLTSLQQPAGFFPFPDLRGRNIRFGDMTERQLRDGKTEVRDGWIVTAESGGGTQFDTGICGTALLLAGKLSGNKTWQQSGLRAADWALAQPCCANFNYNAFSVSLLSHAFRVTGNVNYLAGAWKKFQIGVAPGQAPNGRWLDPHNARTVYHVILLRGLADLATALPSDRMSERAELDRVILPAIRALLDEFDAMGQTVEALPELQKLATLFPADARLRSAVSTMTAGIIGKCTDGKRVKMGAQPDQLAAALIGHADLTK